MNYALHYNLLITRSKYSKRTKGRTHLHHINPVHNGGTDAPDNLVHLTIKEHWVAHRLLSKIHGRYDDRAAYLLLKGIGNKHFEICRLGGLKTGKMNAESNWINEIKSPESLSLGGIRGSEKARELKQNAFFGIEEHRKAAIKGGAAQGKVNATNGHLTKISKLSKRNSGQFWITNDIQCKMIYSTEQIPDGWRKGRVCPRKK